MEGFDQDGKLLQLSEQLRVQNIFSNNLSIWSNSGGDALVVPCNNGYSSNGTASGVIWSGKLAFGSTTNHADRYNSFPTNKNKKNNDVQSYLNKSVGRPASNHVTDNDVVAKNTSNNNNSRITITMDKDKNNKRLKKSLPASESLPRGEAIGGYIFVCNKDTMEENLKRRLFGLPSRYRDSVRAIRPGLPLFLYNYSTHQLHGIFEAASFGGSNIDPAAWEDNKCPGESRFPAQVRVATRKICDPLEEDAFRPILHHYDGPKFRLELSVPEALSLLDIFAEKVFA